MAGNIPRIPSYPPTPIRLAPLRDFTGGLNLRADAFQLDPNESPDMMDVSVEIGGGFVQRLAVQPYISGTGGWLGTEGGHPVADPPIALWSYQSPSVSQVIVSTVDGMFYSTGTGWTQIGSNYTTSFTGSLKPRSAVFQDNFYTVFGSIKQPTRWNGTTVATLSQAWNETVGTEGSQDGNMPEARYICSHMSRIFVAYTTESGTDYPNRIRWSHAGFAEDWRQEDYIDIDVGRDGDFITGICEFKDRLYIFKNNSISILSGYGVQNFQVLPYAQDMGAVSQEALLVTEVGLFFFSWPQGVYLDKGNGPYPIFDKLYPLVRDGWIPSAFRSQIAMGWINKNLWVSVPYGGSSVNARTYVYNPWIWKNRYLRFLQGPWYPYSIPASAFATVEQLSGSTMYLAAHPTEGFVGMLEQNASIDSWGNNDSRIFTNNIPSYYKTSWQDLGQVSVIKRWRHPDIVMRAEGGSQILVEVRKDYDPATIYKTFQIAPVVPTLGLEWDAGAPVPSVTTVGTAGTTSYSYVVTALVGTLEAEKSQEITITTGNAVLSATNYNQISWGALANASSYNVYGRTAGAEKLLGNTSGTSFNDQGGALGTQNPPASSQVGGMWDDGSGTLGEKWSVLDIAAEAVARGGSMGTARAVQLAFYAPVAVDGTGQQWGVDAVSLKYIPKRVRG